MKDKKYYVVNTVISEDMTVSVLGENKIKMTWADGMVGVLPVFTNKRKARKYANTIGKDISITEFVKAGQ